MARIRTLTHAGTAVATLTLLCCMGQASVADPDAVEQSDESEQTAGSEMAAEKGAEGAVATPAEPPPRALVETALPEDVAGWSPGVRAAVLLRAGGHPTEAAELLASQRDELAADSLAYRHARLLEGLAWHDAENHEAAVEALRAGPAADEVGGGLARWTLGSALEELGQPGAARDAYGEVPADSRWYGGARIRMGRLLREAGEAGLAIEWLEPLPRALVGTEWEPPALYQLARAVEARGAEGDRTRAREIYRQVWVEHASSGSAPFAEARMEALASSPQAEAGTLSDRIQRATPLASTRQSRAVVEILEDSEEAMAELEPSAEACAGWSAYGRSRSRLRDHREAVPWLQRVADGCLEIGEQDAVVKSLYLLGRSRGATGSTTRAVGAYSMIAEHFAEHSYADDGLFKAAELIRESDPAGSQALLERMASEFPGGDMHGLALWTLANGALDRDDVDAARGWLDQAIGDHGPESPWPDREEYLRASYWRARLEGPDLRTPTSQWTEEQREAAAGRFAALAGEHALHWYGALAYNRLAELDPVVARALAGHQRGAWTEARAGDSRTLRVDADVIGHPKVAEARALLRAGVVDASRDALEALQADRPAEGWAGSLDTRTYLSHLYAQAEDHHRSHNLLRLYFRDAHPEELRPETWEAFEHAYPLAYGDQVAAATSDKRVPALTFQALVREESAFLPRVRSWAGAIGLSQLMWPTAQGTARQMGIPLTRESVQDPETNLSIGAYFLDGLYRRFEGHPVFALAGYNAGGGRVSQWLDAFGELPVDEFVEEIPFKETRNYVKRVLTSNQTYLALYGVADEEVEPYVQLDLRTAREAAGR